MKTSLIIFFSALFMGLFTQVQAQNQEAEKLYQEALFQMEALGNFSAAIEKFEKLVTEFPQNNPLASRALLMAGRCYEKLGRMEAKNAYNRIIEHYGDQREVVMEARARLMALAEETPGFTIRKVGPALGDGFGRVSPDGRNRTFVDWNTGDLAIEDLTTGEQRRLTNKGSWLESEAFAHHSRWSPDGKNVLFLSDRRGTIDIWRLPMDEGKASDAPELVKEGIGKIDSQGLTLGGSFHYVTDKNAWNVYVTALDNESGNIIEPPALPIKYLGRSTHSPAYSPDGKYLAYVSQRGPVGNERSVICIRSLETGRERNLFPEYNFERLQWSSDNQFLLAIGRDSKDRRAHDLIAKIDRKTGETTVVFRCEQDRSRHRAEQAVWSNDGETIFYVFADKNKRSSLVSRDLNTGRETELYGVSEWDIDNEKIMGSSLSRSPDGNWLAFITGYRKRNIKIIPSSGGEPRDVYSFKQPDHRAAPIAWSSDGNYIIFGKYEDSHGGMVELWSIAVDGGEPQKLDLTMIRLGTLSMHPNGKHLAFSSLGPELLESELWVMENFLPEE